MTATSSVRRGVGAGWREGDGPAAATHSEGGCRTNLCDGNLRR